MNVKMPKTDYMNKPRRETQASISSWAEETFGPVASNARVAARANEEMAELFRVLTIDDKSPMAAVEIADVVIVLYRLAARLGVDLHEAIDVKMAVNRSRKWDLDGTGHGYHVREGAEKTGSSSTLMSVETAKMHLEAVECAEKAEKRVRELEARVLELEASEHDAIVRWRLRVEDLEGILVQAIDVAREEGSEGCKRVESLLAAAVEPRRCSGYADTIGGGSQVRCGDVEDHEGPHRHRVEGEWERPNEAEPPGPARALVDLIESHTGKPMRDRTGVVTRALAAEEQRSPSEPLAEADQVCGELFCSYPDTTHRTCVRPKGHERHMDGRCRACGGKGWLPAHNPHDPDERISCPDCPCAANPETLFHMCQLCGESIVSTGLCSKCSRAWGEGKAYAERAARSGTARPDVAGVIRKLGKCRRCSGDGEYLPTCFRCDDSTDDHECPGPRACGECEQTGLTKDAREALVQLGLMGTLVQLGVGEKGGV